MKRSFTILILSAVTCVAQVPSIITYQGRLNVGGTNVYNGTGHFKFSLVNGVSRQATASGSVTAGFLTSATILDRGNGYYSVPQVTIADSTGSNAVATAVIAGGVVVGITIDNPGRNYSATPVVLIAPPTQGLNPVTFWSNDGSASGGGEPQRSIPLPVSQGMFVINLGDLNVTNMVSAIPSGVFTNADIRLRIWFSDGNSSFQQFFPDQRLTSVGYAMMAGNILDGAVTPNKIAPGAVTASALAAGAVTASALSDGAVTTAKIAQGSITADKIVPGIYSTAPNGMQVFTNSGTWIRPPGVNRVYVKVWGGGGGGNRCGGGGGGAYCEGVVTVTDNVAIVVGAGGLPDGDTTAPGGDGGESAFLTLRAGGGKGAPCFRPGGGDCPCYSGGAGGIASGGAISADGEVGAGPGRGGESGRKPWTGGAPGGGGSRFGNDGEWPGGGGQGNVGSWGKGGGGLVIVYY